jgi:hypothetical protein
MDIVLLVSGTCEENGTVLARRSTQRKGGGFE